MKTDKNGISTCQKGTENYEKYWSDARKRICYQYDYRTPAGDLFSCIGKSLQGCRLKMNNTESWNQENVERGREQAWIRKEYRSQR